MPFRTTGPFEDQLTLSRFHANGVARCESAREDVLGKAILEVALDRALEGPGAVGRIVTHIGKEVLGRVGDLEVEVTLREPLLEVAQLHVHDVA